MGYLDDIKRAAHSSGRHATAAVRVRLYGTREPINRSASNRPPETSAIGQGPRSVWQGGPIRRKNGAPALKP